MSDISKLARPNILNLKPYSSARAENKNKNISIWLDANENPWPPYGFEEVTSRRYEFQQPPSLKKSMANTYNIASHQLLITRGADEAIDLLIRVFCEPGEDKILQCSPTFGMYQVAADIQNCKLVDVPLLPNTFQLDMPKMLEALPDCKLAFICSPGNPTAVLLHEEDIAELCRAAQNSLIVVDEAYVDFTDTYLPKLLNNFDNLVLLRTLSKAYSLAGERIGGMIANPEIIELCGRVLAPYPLSATACRMAETVLSADGFKENKRRMAEIVQQRKVMEGALAEMPCVEKVYPSDCNFLLLKMQNAEKALDALESNGIKARDRSSILPNHIRLTIGTVEQNKKVLSALKSL